MRSLIRYMALALIAGCGTSCEKILLDADPADTPLSNFELLWNTLDSRYALFPYKKIDWDSVYAVYRPMISNEMPGDSLFRVLGNMLLELRDAHTDISSPYGRIQYDYTAGSSDNFNGYILLSSYLTRGSKTENGITYKQLDDVGYIYIPTFTRSIPDNTVKDILGKFSNVKGIIIDVRQNSGGNELNAKVVANQFFDRKRKVETRKFKTGPAHDDYVSVDWYIEPENSLKIDLPTVVLTNRRCYSACNTFVCWMSALPHVLVAGDRTGGGGGTPYQSELPNGWVYRYSSNISFRPDGLNIDEGIPPDTLVLQSFNDTLRNLDTMIEFAIDYIHSRSE